MTQSSFNRPGAIDLSALKAAAEQNAPAGGSAAGRYVLQVTEEQFDAEVMRRSIQHPVVVEFYSPRVNNGEQLSKVLAGAADEAAGKYLVARVNVDGAPRLVQMLGLQAVPTVIGVIGGQIAPLFQGVLPDDEVKLYLDELVKAAVANGIVGRAEPVAGPAEAEEESEERADPRFAAADEALERGDFAAARDEFDKLVQANPGDSEAIAGRAQAGLYARAAGLDEATVLAEAAAHPDDIGAQLAAADAEMMSDSAGAAFDRLVALIRTTSGDDREQVRLRLLELFETLGNSDERVLKARRELMSALF